MSSASLSSDEIEDRFFILSKIEIIKVLQELALRREPITVYFNGGRDFILTAILSAREDGLVFDLGGDEYSNNQLSRVENCFFLTHPDGIKIQFSGKDPQRFIWGDAPAFWVPIPDRVIRLQRREYYRNSVPLTQNLFANLYNEDAHLIGKWQVHDLSVGGVGLTSATQPDVVAEQKIAQISINLGPKNTVYCPASVRHVTTIDGYSATPRYRIGLQFIDLPHRMDVAIQRYIIQLEYERRKLAG